MKKIFSLFTISIIFISFSLSQNNLRNNDWLFSKFLNPPSEYGPLPYYWWTGEKLSIVRIAEQLDQYKYAGFAGVNINYTHTVLGYTYRGNPPLFSDDWWLFWEKVVAECAKRDLTIGFDDYLVTHGSPELATIGSKIYKENPNIASQLIRQRSDTVNHGDVFSFKNIKADNIFDLVAYSIKDNKIDPNNFVNLLKLLKSGKESWQVPEGNWYVSIIYTEKQPYGAMNPLYAKKVIEYYFDKFENHSNGLIGKTVNYFFQDELTFGGIMPYWSPDLPVQFRKSKGYDLLPELTSLFTDIGDRTPKIRLDYYDVATQMMEDAYFKPIFEWCEKRNVIYAHDQSSRADVIDGVQYYGDYFRTLRWYHAPGTDRMPDLIRGKVVSSIAQLYNRPRTWFEAYHSEGWGITPSNITKWDLEAIMYGYNLINYHSSYYTTLGGWWEWAPGDITFRQPYWSYFFDHYQHVKRLCYILSQGKHKCDIAILFPSSTVQTDIEGTRPGTNAVESRKLLNIGESLFKEHSIDFDFIDDQSMHNSVVNKNMIEVSGGSYKVIILPAIKSIRSETLNKLLSFYRNGGKVIALSELPEASDRTGRNDQVLDNIIREIFGKSAGEVANLKSDTFLQKNETGGKGYYIKSGFDVNKIQDFISNSIDWDFNSNGSKIQVMHRKVENRDIFALFHNGEDSVHAKLSFSIKDKKPEEWDYKTGIIKKVNVTGLTKKSVETKLLFNPNELKIIVFNDGVPDVEFQNEKESKTITEKITLDNNWDIRIEPILNNRWGDFRSPASDDFISAETRRFRYNEERSNDISSFWYKPDFIDTSWSYAISSFGPKFWLLGPINKNTDILSLEKNLSELKSIDPSIPIKIDDQLLKWIPQQYSLRWGILNDPVITNQTGLSIHGPIGYVPKEIVHIKSSLDNETWYLFTSAMRKSDQNTKLGVGSRAGYKIWMNGKEFISKSDINPEMHVNPWWLSLYPYDVIVSPVKLKKGINSILLKLNSAKANSYSRLFFVLNDSLQDISEPLAEKDPSGDVDFVPKGFLSTEYYTKNSVSDFDVYSQNRPKALWYRFVTPPGMKKMIITAHGSLKVWINGEEILTTKEENSNTPANKYEQSNTYSITPIKPILTNAVATIRIEPRPGYYAGAAIPEPVRYICADGKAALGDWKSLGLESYSGSIRYSKIFSLSKNILWKSAYLNLGDISSAAKIWINSKYVGSSFMKPWKLEITDYLIPGDNKIEISVANTLANHYSIGMPADQRYIRKGQTRSGLFGPVEIEFFK